MFIKKLVARNVMRAGRTAKASQIDEMHRTRCAPFGDQLLRDALESAVGPETERVQVQGSLKCRAGQLFIPGSQSPPNPRILVLDLENASVW